jgi:drug/metabolite transporter (DMT)-like permease
MPSTSSRARGIAWALLTAVISGVAVFLNSYGVRAAGNATVYTTAKNLVAALVLIGAVAVAGWQSKRRKSAGGQGAASARADIARLAAAELPSAAAQLGPRRLRLSPGQVAGLAVISVIGGSVPFVLFFEGLARTSATDAAFVQKTLLVWVALLAVPLLGERLGLAHLGAIALLLAGQVAAAGGLAGLRAGSGEALVLAATLLWSVEVILAKRLLSGPAALTSLTVGVARMGLGSVLLVAWVAVTGHFGSLTGLTGAAWGWVLLTGAILAAYVAAWFAALACAPAVDVTAVLVAGAIITALLSAVTTGATLPASELLGLALVAAGTALMTIAPRLRRTAAVAR